MGMRILARRSLGTQVTLAFTIMLVPLIAVGVVGTMALRSTATTYRDVAKGVSDQLLITSEIRGALFTAEEEAVNYVAEGDFEAAPRYALAAQQVTAGFERLEALLPPGERALADAAGNSWDAARHVGDANIVKPPYERTSGDPYPLTEFHVSVVDAATDLDASTALSLRRISTRINDVERQENRQEVFLIVVLVLSVLGTVGMAARLRRAVRKPLVELRKAAVRFGDDELDHRVPVGGHAELDDVAQAFNTMAERLTDSRSALAHQAFHDPLTGLANRALFVDRAEAALAQARRTGHQLAVLFLDLDAFKAVNDDLGHSAGDDLLVEVARRLERDVREADAVARFGGDEFAVLLPVVENVAEATRVAQRVIDGLAEPVALAGYRVRVRASVGVAGNILGDSVVDDVDGLLRNADAAMYHAKRAGRGRWHVFEPSADEPVEPIERRLELVPDVGRGGREQH